MSYDRKPRVRKWNCGWYCHFAGRYGWHIAYFLTWREAIAFALTSQPQETR